MGFSMASHGFIQRFFLIFQPGLVLDSDIVVLQDPFQALQRDADFEARQRGMQNASSFVTFCDHEIQIDFVKIPGIVG